MNRLYPVLLCILLILLYRGAASADTIWDNDYPDEWDDITIHSARLSYIFPESQNIIWLAEKDRTAFKGMAGSISTSRFIVDEEARIVAPLSSRLYLRFYYHRLEEFGVKRLTDRMELEYRHPSGQMMGILGSAFHEKEYLDVGFFFGFMAEPDRYIRTYWIPHRWLYNIKNHEDGRYSAFPHRFILESLYRLKGPNRLYLDGCIELPWRQTIGEPPDAEGAIRRNGSEGNFSVRFERFKSDNCWGFEAGIESETLEEHFPTGVNWRREYSAARFKGFYFKRRGDWWWECDFPLTYSFERLEQKATSTELARLRRALEIHPECVLRRYLGRAPFLELSTLILIRNLRQEGELEGTRRIFDANLRIGIAFGAHFNRSDSFRKRERKNAPVGELRVRVMQNLDRSWIGNFGGGSLILVIAW